MKSGDPVRRKFLQKGQLTMKIYLSPLQERDILTREIYFIKDQRKDETSSQV